MVERKVGEWKVPAGPALAWQEAELRMPPRASADRAFARRFHSPAKRDARASEGPLSPHLRIACPVHAGPDEEIFKCRLL